MLRRLIVVVIAAVALSLAACGGSGTGGSATRTGLAAAMASVSGTGPAARYFEYGDVAALRRLGIVHLSSGGRSAPIDARWNSVAGLGASGLVDYSALLPKLIDLNVFAGDTAISIGNPPDHATRIDGALNAKAISAKLTGLGAKPRSFAGSAGLSFGPDNSLGLPSSGKLAEQQYGALALVLRQIAVTDKAFAVSPNSATLEKVLSAGSRSLLDTPHYRAVADCLGDVIGAVVLRPEKDTRSSVVAVGVRTPTSAAGPVDDVLCVLPKSGAQAAVHRSFEQRLAVGATDPLTHARISTYVAKTAVDDPGDLVRTVLTLNPKAPAGFLIEALDQNLAPYWDGSCSATELASRRC